MHQYKLISRKGEGTFSEVLKAQSLKTGNYVAIKCMKTHFNSVDQVNQLREIQALRKTSPHPNLIKLLEILYDEPTGRLALVFELMEMNMYELIKDRKTYLPQAKVKLYMYQVFKAIDQMHKKGIFHRDIKPENILLLGDTVKVADLGSCRGMFGEHPYTEYISTRWYRSPECLMTSGYYDSKMDIWGAGCVMFEILTLVPLFPGKNEVDMIHRIHNVLGTPHQSVLDRFKSHADHMEFNFPPKTGTGVEKLLAHASPDCIELIKAMLTYDPEKRITSAEILQHEYFRELVEAERQKDFHSTLNSVGTSPSFKQFQQTLYTDQEKSVPIHHQKTHYQGAGGSKKKNSKVSNANATMHKFPALNVNLKVEGIFKHSHDTSTEEEGESYKESMLPPLSNFSAVHLDKSNGGNQSMKKTVDIKKLKNTFLKQNPYMPGVPKKGQKPSFYNVSPEYFVVGKKAT